MRRRPFSTRTSTNADARGRPTWPTASPRRKRMAAPARSQSRSVDHHVERAARRRARSDSSRPSRAVRTSARRSCSRHSCQGYNVVFDAANLDAASAFTGCSACSTPATCRSSGAARWRAVPGSGLPDGQTCTENQRPANEPSLAGDDGEGDRAAGRRGRPAWTTSTHGRRASSCRSRARRSTSRITSRTPCEQIGETIAFDQRDPGRRSTSRDTIPTR